MNIASAHSLRATTTVCFFSLNFSKIPERQGKEYAWKRFFNPLARPVKHFIAKATTTTFESFKIT